MKRVFTGNATQYVAFMAQREREAAMRIIMQGMGIITCIIAITIYGVQHV